MFSTNIERADNTLENGIGPGEFWPGMPELETFFLPLWDETKKTKR